MNKPRCLTREPSFEDAFAVLCLQAAGEGRGPVLFGDSVARAPKVMAPFLVGASFPETYLEFPLVGDPFLDATLLYDKLAPHTRIASPLAQGTEAALDFFATAYVGDGDGISLGLEVDCGKEDIPQAGMHFQHRARRDLVRPFFEAIGEPQRATLYLDQGARMPEGWPLSFFGLFRGRPEAPLRVCGYISASEKAACAADPARLARVLDQAGFSAYDRTMLEQASRVLAMAPDGTDFQLDVLPDATLGDVFAIDVRFDNMQAAQVRASFERGAGAAIVDQLKEWGIADDRADLMADIALTRGVSVLHEDGSTTGYGFSLMPGWLKVRWRAGVLQPSKMYLRAGAGPVAEGAD